MSQKESNYYAILTADVRYSDKLSSSEKLFFAEITALCNKTGECWAGNKHFAELYSVDPSTVSKWVSRLKENGFIKVRYVKDGKQIKERFISINRGSENNQYPIGNNQGGTEKTQMPLLEKSQEGIENTPKSTTTSNNNTRETTTITNISEVTPEMKKVIQEWNQTFEKVVDTDDEKLLLAIRNALKEHSVDEIKQAIKFRSKAKFYEEQAFHLRDNPKSFFQYPQTIKNDMRRYPYKLITYEKKCELEMEGKAIKFEKDSDKEDSKGQPLWRMYD